MVAVESTCRFPKGWSLGQTGGEVEGAGLKTLGDSSGLRDCLTICIAVTTRRWEQYGGGV